MVVPVDLRSLIYENQSVYLKQFLFFLFLLINHLLFVIDYDWDSRPLTQYILW